MFNGSGFLSEGSDTHLNPQISCRSYLAHSAFFFSFFFSDKHIENAVKQLLIISKFQCKSNPVALKPRKLLGRFHSIQTCLQNSLSFFKALTASFVENNVIDPEASGNELWGLVQKRISYLVEKCFPLHSLPRGKVHHHLGFRLW